MINKYQGSLLGLACGDAVGTTVEFKNPDHIYTPVTDMTGGGPFNLKAGQWTDDTSLALCLALSLIEKGYDLIDQMQRYWAWYKEGYMSSNGYCFDIGHTTRTALEKFNTTGNPYAGDPAEHNAGNGSLMRLTPVPMFYAKDMDRVIFFSGDSSKTTHGAKTAVDACRFYGSLIAKALNGATKEEILAPDVSLFEREPLDPLIEEVALGYYKEKNPPTIVGSGFVVKSMEAALWSFYNTDNFRDAILDAVNLGNDADTTAAICGQLAGAYYGVDDIPVSWLNTLAMRDKITEMADSLYNCSI